MGPICRRYVLPRRHGQLLVFQKCFCLCKFQLSDSFSPHIFELRIEMISNPWQAVLEVWWKNSSGGVLRASYKTSSV